jgi:DNA replication protein DnaC
VSGNTRRAWRDLTRRAEQEEWTYRDFLALVVSEEIAQRQQTRVGRLERRARFPFLKTIDDFNFLHQSTVRLSLLGSALASEFVTDVRCVILSGKPGRGKTHLAVAIAYRAIQNGFDARFVTAAELIDDLSAAFRTGRLVEALGPYAQPSVLVVDESAISPTAPTRPISSSTSSTTGIGRSARWSSPRTRRCQRGATCCTTTTTSRRPFSNASSSADDSSH